MRGGAGAQAGDAVAPATRLLEALRSATVGEYEIRGEIGRGGMAAVYLAYDLRLNRKVAMKVMLPELAYYDGMEERFKREARTAAKLDHPNIVVIYSVRDDAELLFFAMKFIEGASLDQLIRAQPALPIAVAQYVLAQLASGLQYAHDEGVVHRDIKPGNVLIDLRGNVFVTDFGIAKATESSHLTRTGSVIGTPTYMSPEQCLGSEQTHASDQYSLGVVAYEIIAGRPPFLGSTVEKQWAHIKEPPEPLVSLRPDCPPELSAAIMRMLAKEPSERWPALRHAIPAFATGLRPGDDTPRTTLADLVRFMAPGHTHDFAITPASPLPKGPPGPPKHVWTSLAITPADAALDVGASLQLTATFAPPADPRVATPPVSWSSSANRIVSVSDSGVATAHVPGSAVVIAHAGTLAAASSVTARPARVATIQLTPPSASLEVGTTLALHATLRDASGNTLTDRAVSWTSSNPTTASVSLTGLVTVHALGAATITASSESISASANVSIVPDAVAQITLTPPSLSLAERGSEHLAAAVINRRGKPITGRALEWRSANPAIAAVGPDGSVTAKSAGRTTITVSVEGRSGSADVVVRPADVATVWVTPLAPTISVGDTLVFTVDVRDREGHPLTGRTVTWQSSDPATLTIDRNATASGVGAGTAAVTAECGGVAAAVRVTVAPPVVAKLEIDARATSLRAGKRMRLRAKATDRAGREIPLLPNVTWRSSDPQIAAVESDGTLVALREGSVAVTASVPEHEAHATLAITPPAAPFPVARAALIGAGAVAVGIAAFLLLPKGDEPGDPSSGTQVESTPARVDSVPVGTISPSPTTAQTPQTPPPTPAPTVDPSPPPAPSPGPAASVASLRITSGNPLSIEVGDQSRVTLRALGDDGTDVTRPRVTWAAVDPSIITVNRDGLITGRAEGRTAATVTADGATARVEVVVRQPSPARVAIAPKPSSLRVGQEARLGAGVFDRRGSALGGPVTWQSSNTGVASVDNAGMVRALRAGEVTISANAGAVADSVRLAVAPEAARPDPVTRPVSQPPPPAPTPTVAAAPNADAARAAARAAGESAAGTEALAVAQALAAAMPRGQFGPVSPVGQFAKFVRDNTPEMVGAPQPGRRTVSDTTAEAVITLPLRWKNFTGRVQTGSVDVLVTLALRDGAWRRTAARNLNSP